MLTLLMILQGLFLLTLKKYKFFQKYLKTSRNIYIIIEKNKMMKSLFLSYVSERRCDLFRFGQDIGIDPRYGFRFGLREERNSA